MSYSLYQGCPEAGVSGLRLFISSNMTLFRRVRVHFDKEYDPSGHITRTRKCGQPITYQLKNYAFKQLQLISMI